MLENGYTCEDEMKRVGEAYELPMISVRNVITQDLENKTLTWSDYSQDEARAAERILRELATSEGAVAKSALLAAFHDEVGSDASQSGFDLLISWLGEDFYIEQTKSGDQIVFKDKWLKDWWRKYHA